MEAIVAVDNNWGIGKGGQLLAPISADLKRFKTMTTGNAILVGRKTLESFPGGKPLPNRINIVLTANPDYQAEGCVICQSKEQALSCVKKLEEEGKTVFVCGGAAVYQLFLEDCSLFHVTKIDASFEADTFFPNLDALGYTCTTAEEEMEEEGLRFRFVEYRLAD